MRRRDIMRAWGFSADPFSLFVAETEDRLERSFVVPHYFDEVVSDPERPQPTFVFGWRGEGKSTLCKMVAQRLRRLDRPPLVVEATDFSGWPVAKLDSLTLDDHIWRILQACVSALVEALEANDHPAELVTSSDRALLEDFVLRWLPTVDHGSREARLGTLLDRVAPNERRIHRYGGKGYRRISSYLRAKRLEFEQAKIQNKDVGRLLAALMLVAPTTPDAGSFAGATSQGVFDLFVRLVRRLGFPSLYVLVDKVDEIDAVTNRPDRVAKLVAPLARSARFLESEGVGIKLFLPEEARGDLVGIRFDRIRTRRIQWDDERLKTFLRSRIHAYSDGRSEGLEHVFEDYPAFEPLLLRASAQAPRNMLRILDHIVSEHSERESPPPRIDRNCASTGLRIFSEHRMLEADAKHYQDRLYAWDREHEPGNEP
jgi:hypothetical protein